MKKKFCRIYAGIKSHMENNNTSLEELRKKTIIIGLIGIFIFASSIVGAALSYYVASIPDYASLRSTILIFSLIDFVFGIGILLVFRKHINSYKTLKDKLNELPNRI